MKEGNASPKPTKVLYVITKANWGGAQRYVFDLATEAKSQGYEAVVAVGHTGPLTEKLQLAGIRTISIELRQHKNFLKDLFTFGPLLSLIQIIRAERPDVVHVNSAKAAGLGSLAARIAGAPLIIFTAHGWEFNAPRNIFSKIGIGFFSWLTILLAHKTIAVSKAVRHDTRWWPFVRARITVIPNGIGTIAFQSHYEARASLSPPTVGQYWIGMLSELNPTKRVEDAIRAFALIAQNHPEAILIILGEGPTRQELTWVIDELQLGHRVSLLGFKKDASTLLKAFDLFVHSSQSEALGYVVLEAGCAALPVVATNVGGIPEIIPDNEYGLLVSPRNPEALAGAIETMLKDPRSAIERGARLRARVETLFSKEKMISATFALYR